MCRRRNPYFFSKMFMTELANKFLNTYLSLVEMMMITRAFCYIL